MSVKYCEHRHISGVEVQCLDLNCYSAVEEGTSASSSQSSVPESPAGSYSNWV